MTQKCIGCYTEIPYGKSQCPLCGAPIQVQESIYAPQPVTFTKLNHSKIPQPGCRPVFKVLGYMIGAFFSLSIVLAIISPDRNPSASTPVVTKSPADIAREKENEEHDEAQYHAKSFIERSLKAPASAKFPGWSEFAAVKKNGFWEVYTYVDAQNSYGALLRSKFYVKMKNLGDKWQLIDIDTY